MLAVFMNNTINRVDTCYYGVLREFFCNEFRDLQIFGNVDKIGVHNFIGNWNAGGGVLFMSHLNLILIFGGYFNID